MALEFPVFWKWRALFFGIGRVCRHLITRSGAANAHAHININNIGPGHACKSDFSGDRKLYANNSCVGWIFHNDLLSAALRARIFKLRLIKRENQYFVGFDDFFISLFPCDWDDVEKEPQTKFMRGVSMSRSCKLWPIRSSLANIFTTVVKDLLHM